MRTRTDRCRATRSTRGAVPRARRRRLRPSSPECTCRCEPAGSGAGGLFSLGGRLRVVRLQYPAPDLVEFDRLEQGAEVAFAEALVALALDDLEEDRSDDRL